MVHPQTILLVDDSEDDLFLLRIAFEKCGFNPELQEAHNGEEAIAYLGGDEPYNDRNRFPLPTVMLLDLNMPRKNGFDVLRWVRAQDGLKRLTVFVLSASARTEDIEQAFDAGANAYLVKPGSLEALIEMIRGVQVWMQLGHFPSLAAQ